MQKLDRCHDKLRQYRRLKEVLERYLKITVLDFDEAAAAECDRLKTLRLRIGTLTSGSRRLRLRTMQRCSREISETLTAYRFFGLIGLNRRADYVVYGPGPNVNKVKPDPLSDSRKRKRILAKVVELRFFSGLDVVETADALGVSESNIKRDWQMAKAWLHR